MPILILFGSLLAMHALASGLKATVLGRHDMGAFPDVPGFTTLWAYTVDGGLSVGRDSVRVLRYGYTSSDGRRFWEVQKPDGRRVLALETDLSPTPSERGINAH